MNNSYFEDKLLLAGLSKQTFSNSTNIPIRTISNWLTSRKGKEGKTQELNSVFNSKIIKLKSVLSACFFMRVTPLKPVKSVFYSFYL